MKCNIPLAIANDKYCWFEWNADIDSLKPIFDAAKTKLGIKEYGIVDFIKDADTEKLNLWIQNADAETYTGFMTELNSHSLLDVSSKIKSIKLFKFSDGSFYSYDDIITHIEELIICIKRIQSAYSLLQKQRIFSKN